MLADAFDTFFCMIQPIVRDNDDGCQAGYGFSLLNGETSGYCLRDNDLHGFVFI